MEPSRPPVSKPSSRSEHRHRHASAEPHYEQAGRTAINLAAQQSAQSLREASKRSHLKPRSTKSSPSLSRAGCEPVSNRVHEAKSSIPMPKRRDMPLYMPALQQSAPEKPLSQHPLPSSLMSHRSGQINSDETAAEKSEGAVRILCPRKSLPLLGSNLVKPSSRSLHASEMSEKGTLASFSQPRSVRDLGSDYTRYFNPFASAGELQEALAQPTMGERTMSGEASGLVVSSVLKRLSDPFNDTKRSSTPFSLAPSPSRTPSLQIQQAQTVSQQSAWLQVPRLNIPARSPTPAFIGDADPEKAIFWPWIDDRLGAPEVSFPLITDEKEDDDDMHMPMWDDDVRLKPKFKDHFTKENITGTIGLVLMLSGLLCVFVVLPVISYTGTSLLGNTYETPLDQMGGPPDPYDSWSYVNNRTYPLFSNTRKGLIDPDTPERAKTLRSVTGDTLMLVFSDEFNAKNRTFYHGDDPYWFGFEGWYGATQDLEWYDPDAINTDKGTLQLQLDQFHNHNLDFRSGMLNSWNQLCFKGGVLEVSMSLPGPAGVHGLWPGVWTMGNLGRPGYLATTDGLWPYTYNDCDFGITPNQSMIDGTSHLPGQRLPSCTCHKEDHPTPGIGRGAPEIDIAEVSGDWSGMGLGVATQSYQVAPFDIWYYPNYDFMETPNYNISNVNTYTGGPYQQAVSTTTMLNDDWYDGKAYQRYAFEYQPGGTNQSFIAWVVGSEETMRFDARAVGPNGNVGQRLISEEPMSMILNLGISYSWVDIEFAQLRFPTIMRIDYVRWYQRDGEQMVTCDPPGFETTDYIRQHPRAYQNPNLTHWADAGYEWPKNMFMHECEA